MKNTRFFFLHSTVAEMDWLTQRSGAKQQALLSSKIETPNKTASVQELHCCKEPFSSQVQPYNLPHYVSATGSRGHCRVSGQRNGAETPAESKPLLWKNHLFRNNCAACQSILTKWDSEMGICAPLIQTTFSPLSTSFLECHISWCMPACVLGSLLS